MHKPVIAGNWKMYKIIDDGGARTAYCLLPTSNQGRKTCANP